MSRKRRDTRTIAGRRVDGGMSHSGALPLRSPASVLELDSELAAAYSCSSRAATFPVDRVTFYRGRRDLLSHTPR